MSTVRMRVSRCFLSLLVLCLTARHALADSPTYHETVSVGQDGRLSLQLTNDSEVPIAAFVLTESSSSGTEARTYFDVYTTPGESGLPIPPGTSISRKLSAFAGTGTSEVGAEVPAVIFKDGSSAGDPVWINTILARRVRLHDRLLSLRELLSPLVGTGISPDAIVQKLRASLLDAVKQLPDDDLRDTDTMAFFDATSTFDRERRRGTDYTLRSYLQRLDQRALTLEYSRPDLDTIKTLPASTSKRSSESKLPIAK